MQNFKIKRAPWKDNEVNSMRSRKEKRKRGQYKLVYLYQLFPMPASFSQKEKRKSTKNILKCIANCYNLLKQIIGKL